MACYSPLRGWHAPGGITFTRSLSHTGVEMQVSCGQCIGCRLQSAREWAIRSVHEASLHEENCFVTLTYSDRDLPLDFSIDKGVVQKFLKRLRYRYSPKKIRYLGCGEYGEQYHRPHYHLLLFGHDFHDKTPFNKQLSISSSLTELWPFGFSTVGQVNYKTAAYVGRYVTKKLSGKLAEGHYVRGPVDYSTGEQIEVSKEWLMCSLKPGIGDVWFDKFKHEVFPDDFIIIDGKQMKPPRRYLTLMKRTHPEVVEKVLWNRRKHAEKHAEESTLERLAVREICARSKLTRREFDNVNESI